MKFAIRPQLFVCSRQQKKPQSSRSHGASVGQRRCLSARRWTKGGAIKVASARVRYFKYRANSAIGMETQSNQNRNSNHPTSIWCRIRSRVPIFGADRGKHMQRTISLSARSKALVGRLAYYAK
jgi:hypothetical protein